MVLLGVLVYVNDKINNFMKLRDAFDNSIIYNNIPLLENTSNINALNNLIASNKLKITDHKKITDKLHKPNKPLIKKID
jgi:hypothetical protein